MRAGVEKATLVQQNQASADVLPGAIAISSLTLPCSLHSRLDFCKGAARGLFSLVLRVGRACESPCWA
eukprot:5207201-Amphidinium_carterae.1